MEYYLLMDRWGSTVRDLKDSEREHGVDTYTTERLARHILDFVRYTRFKQYALFTQQRGEEYEQMLAKSEAAGFSREAIDRMVKDEAFWNTTLELGKQ